ncbi:hypothetical protein H7F33_10740 [Pedobacter sp. PAMC26386]|nr:hypothetical protein H7F33_10740 [Pedobacter sp. PAMC26386]
MKFLEQPYQQRLVVSAGTVIEPVTKDTPVIVLHLAGERGRIAGTGTFAVAKLPVRDFVVIGSTHKLNSQIIISVRVYEWDILIGSIFISLDGKDKNSANYKIKLNEVWKTEGATVKVENLQALI